MSCRATIPFLLIHKGLFSLRAAKAVKKCTALGMGEVWKCGRVVRRAHGPKTNRGSTRQGTSRVAEEIWRALHKRRA